MLELHIVSFSGTNPTLRFQGHLALNPGQWADTSGNRPSDISPLTTAFFDWDTTGLATDTRHNVDVAAILEELAAQSGVGPDEAIRLRAVGTSAADSNNVHLQEHAGTANANRASLTGFYTEGEGGAGGSGDMSINQKALRPAPFSPGIAR